MYVKNNMNKQFTGQEIHTQKRYSPLVSKEVKTKMKYQSHLLNKKNF